MCVGIRCVLHHSKRIIGWATLFHHYLAATSPPCSSLMTKIQTPRLHLIQISLAPNHTSKAHQMAQTHMLAHSYIILAIVFIPQFGTQLCYNPIYITKTSILTMYNIDMSPCATIEQPLCAKVVNTKAKKHPVIHTNMQDPTNAMMRTYQPMPLKSRAQHQNAQPTTQHQARQTR